MRVHKSTCLISMILAMGSLHAQSAFSTPFSIKHLFAESTYVASISAGPVWGNSGQAQTLFLVPEIEKAYTTNHKTSAMADGELFLGIQKPLPHQLLGQIGLAGAITSNANLSGNIWDDALPEFNNFTYQYSLRHAHVAIKGKLLADRNYMVIPWISGSLGVGFNSSAGFSNTPLIYEAIATPNFTNNTQTAFTYTVGVGFQRNLTQHVQVGIGYEFADWGQSNLNPAAGQTLGSGLALSHFYTNGFLLNLTYLT